MFYSWVMKFGNISFSQNPILKCLPALLMMLAIFLFSAGRALELQQNLIERIVNKGGHMVGYGILSISFWRMFEFRADKCWLAWALAVLYAASDEFHQTFVPGRYGTIFDVLIYDNLGAFLSLWLVNSHIKQKQPVPQGKAVEEDVLPAKG